MRRQWLVFAMLWLVANNLRLAIFALQPVLPDIRHQLGLSFTATGALTSAAIAMLGLGSIPGTFAGRWLGARRMVTLTAAGIGVASLLRLLPPESFWVFAGTILLSLSASLVQPAIAVLIRRWFATSLNRAAAVYSNGILMGGTIGAAATPFVALAVGWRGSFLVWGALALAIALFWLLLTPSADSPVPQVRIRDALGNPRAWQVTALFTFQNLAYFGAAAWLPFLLAGRDPAYVSLVFTCLNFLSIVPLFLLPALSWPYATSAPWYVAMGLFTIAGAVGLALGLRDQAWALAFLLGLGCAGAFVGSMALPPLIARSETDAAAISAIVFTFGYLLSFASPVAAGTLVDATHQVTTAFLPSVGGGILMAVLGLLVPRLVARSQAAAAAA
ncbi:MAG TPA: MFS transporter [Candidatus Dormibacteraeota bacterium]